MKIDDNGTVREMTESEIAEYKAMYNESTVNEDFEEKGGKNQ